MQQAARCIRDTFYSQPSKAVPWLCLALGVGAGVLSRSPGLGVASTLISGHIWNRMSALMVIEDPRLGFMTLTCPQRDSQGRKQIWLTFDDGPGPGTQKLLDILHQFEARASFFFIGQNIEAYPDLEGLRNRLKTDGHQVANHSWSHPNFMRLGKDASWREIERTQQCLQQNFPDTAQPLFRPPFGYRTSTVFDCLNRAGLKPIGWSLNSLDFLSGTTADLIDRVHHLVEPGAILLFHDGPAVKARTSEALPSILRHLKSQGYHFTVPSPEDMA